MAHWNNHFPDSRAFFVVFILFWGIAEMQLPNADPEPLRNAAGSAGTGGFLQTDKSADAVSLF